VAGTSKAIGIKPRSISLRYWLALWAIDLCSLIRFAAGVIGWIRTERREIRILAYHDVSDVAPRKDALRISTPVDLFEQHIRYLRRKGYRFMSMVEAANRLRRSEVPDKAVVVTFDDGYQSLLNAATPVLVRYSVPATIFVAVDFIGKPEFPWSPESAGFTRPLTWEELSELMSKTTIEVGSHAATHRPLHALSRSEQEAELGSSRRTLEDRLGGSVRAFAYPFGGWDTFPDGLQSLLRTHGYEAACTNVMGANTAGANLFALRRVRVGWNDRLWRFRLKLAGAYDWSDRVRRMLSLLSPVHTKPEHSKSSSCTS